MGIFKRNKPINLTKIRVLSDEGDELTPAVESGTIVSAYLTKKGEGLIEDGEAWYVREDTREEWLSLPGDFEVVS